jgi:hypothetical protein
MEAQSEAESWRAELARISSQLDELKARSDEEYRTLHSALDAQLADVQAALQRLNAEVASLRPSTYARRVEVQIEELRAKGDAAYERLQASMPARVDQASPHPNP